MSRDMIRVNLLPLEDVKAVKFRQRRLPIIPVIFIVFILCFMLWTVSMMSFMKNKTLLMQANCKIADLNVRKKEVDVVWNDVNGFLQEKSRFGDAQIYRKIQWAQVLNILSDKLRTGIWLKSLDIEEKDGVWLISISGFAKPLKRRSMIQEIGIFVSNVKESIDAALLVNAKNTVTDVAERVEESTTTARKQAEKIELTEFTTIFKVKL